MLHIHCMSNKILVCAQYWIWHKNMTFALYFITTNIIEIHRLFAPARRKHYIASQRWNTPQAKWVYRVLVNVRWILGLLKAQKRLMDRLIPLDIPPLTSLVLRRKTFALGQLCRTELNRKKKQEEVRGKLKMGRKIVHDRAKHTCEFLGWNKFSSRLR